jgi:hypothetical protein
MEALYHGNDRMLVPDSIMARHRFRTYVGHNLESWRGEYIGKSIHGGLCIAQSELNPMLAERDLGRNIRSAGHIKANGQQCEGWGRRRFA